MRIGTSLKPAWATFRICLRGGKEGDKERVCGPVVEGESGFYPNTRQKQMRGLLPGWEVF